MTVIMFAVFVGIIAWAYSARRKAAFDEAARLPFDDDADCALRRPAAPREDRS